MGVTIIDIARKAGVTRSTVSKVLNNSKTTVRVSEETRRRIMNVAKEMNYRPSFSAISLAKGKTFTLGFLCGGIDNPFFSELTAIALHEAESRGYHLLISVTEWNKQKELECLDMLLRRRVDGIMMFTGALVPGTKQYDFVHNEKIPVVLSGISNVGLSSVSIDFQPGISEAVAYLIGRGYSRIAMAYGVDITAEVSYDGKIQAFQKACAQHGLEPLEYTFPATIKEARLMGKAIGTKPDRPQAVIVSSDYLATGFIRGLTDVNISVPGDIAIVGIDGVQEGEYYCPALTTVATNPNEIVNHFMNILIEHIHNHDLPPQNIFVPTQLIVRSSA